MKILIFVLSLLLAGCFTAGKRGGNAVLAVYDLGAPPVVRQSDIGRATGLAVEVRAPYWLDSPAIEYRLAYAEPGRLRDYAQARWAAPPAMLVQQRLAQQLDLLPSGQGATKCLLRVDIDEFGQIFDTPDSSRGVLQARLSLLDLSRKVLAERAVRIDEPALSQDSRGGVAALTVAVGRLAGDIVAWRGELAGQGGPKACLQ